MRMTNMQEKVLRMVYKAPNNQRQIAGNGMAPYLMSARSLVRLELLREYRTSYFACTQKGIAQFEAMQNIKENGGQKNVN